MLNRLTGYNCFVVVFSSKFGYDIKKLIVLKNIYLSILISKSLRPSFNIL